MLHGLLYYFSYYITDSPKRVTQIYVEGIIPGNDRWRLSIPLYRYTGKDRYSHFSTLYIIVPDKRDTPRPARTYDNLEY